MDTNTPTSSPQFLPAYLANGDDALKRQAVRKRLRAAMTKLGDISFNTDEFDGTTASGASIVDACNTVPFASPYRLVEVQNADKLKKTDSEKLVEYLQNPSPTTVLQLFAEGLAANTRLYRAVAKGGKKAVIECKQPKKADLASLVRSLAVGYGTPMAPAAATRLINLVGEDTVTLDSEIRKLSLAHQGTDPITESEVVALVAPLAEPKPWEFVDAFSARSLPLCMTLYGRIKSTTPVGLLAMCATRIRELICVTSLDARGNATAASVARALQLKQEWRGKILLGWRYSYSPKELREALLAARDVEQAMKTGTDPEQAFLTWLVDTVNPSR